MKVNEEQRAKMDCESLKSQIGRIAYDLSAIETALRMQQLYASQQIFQLGDLQLRLIGLLTDQ